MCRQEDIVSRNSILHDSKPCPGCKTMIHRIDGCAHMFCTICKTGFNWATGHKISHNNNTNPLVREWLRSRNAVNGAEDENECKNNADASLRAINRLIARCYQRHGEYYELVKDLEHILSVFRNRQTNYRVIDVDQINAELRVKYLLKEIDETQFKMRSLKAVRDSKLSDEVQQLYDMFFIACTQICQEHDVVYTPNDTELRQKFMQKCTELRQYFNECLTIMCECHLGKTDSVVYTSNRISDKWRVCERHDRF